MQIWTFSKHHIFKYDFWEKTQYSNKNFWCFLVTPVRNAWGSGLFLGLNRRTLAGKIHPEDLKYTSSIKYTSRIREKTFDWRDPSQKT